MRKVVGIIILGGVLLAAGVGAASAQEGSAPLRLGQAVIELAVEQTGMEAPDLLAQLREGDTLANLITANGGDVDAFIADVTRTLGEGINSAVENGRITQAQADRILSNLEERVTQAVQGEGPLLDRARQWRQRGGVGPVERQVIQLAAEQTGLEPQAIIEQIREGQSLADVLTANGVEPEAFIDSVIAEAQERFDSRMETFREQLSERIYQATGEA